MVIYLDDLLIMGISVEEKLLGSDAIIFALQNLGFVINKEKFCLKLKKVIKFLGLIINSELMTIYLPPEKVGEIITRCGKPLRTEQVYIREMANLLEPSRLQLIRCCYLAHSTTDHC